MRGNDPNRTRNRNTSSEPLFGLHCWSRNRPGSPSQSGDTGSNPVGTTSKSPGTGRQIPWSKDLQSLRPGTPDQTLHHATTVGRQWELRANYAGSSNSPHGESRLAEILRARLRSRRDSPRLPAWARRPPVGSRSPWVGRCLTIERAASRRRLVRGRRRGDRVGSDAARHGVRPTGPFPACEARRRSTRALVDDRECSDRRGAGLGAAECSLLSLGSLRWAGRAGPHRSRSAFVDHRLSSASLAPARSCPIEGGPNDHWRYRERTGAGARPLGDG